MAYADVSVVCEGAVDETAVFTDYQAMDEWLDALRKEAEGDGYEREVFVIYHEHEMSDGECACAQYATDHHPDYVFGRREVT